MKYCTSCHQNEAASWRGLKQCLHCHDLDALTIKLLRPKKPVKTLPKVKKPPTKRKLTKSEKRKEWKLEKSDYRAEQKTKRLLADLKLVSQDNCLWLKAESLVQWYYSGKDWTEPQVKAG